MPLIVILATGGTIASRADVHGAAVATDTADRLVRTARVSAPGIDLEAVDVLRKNSFNLTLGDLRVVADAISDQLARPEVDGVVVTHGTDTMEETAFLADLVHDDLRPVVFTGAQLSADHDGSDGPANLRDAILLAAAPAARGIGVLVSFAGDVFAARGVRKAHALELAPFTAAGTGPVGHIRGGAVDIRVHPVRRSARKLPDASFDRIRVDAVLAYPGADAALLRAAVAAGARGIVLIGSGTGNPNSALVPTVRDAHAAGIVVALSSRAGDGPVAPIYGGGGAVDAVAAGAVPTGDLPWPQVRILLALLLAESDAEAARRELLRYCAPNTDTARSPIPASAG